MSVHRLESRQFLAATVIEAYPSYYEIYGSDAADVIDVLVSQQSGVMRVNGQIHENVAYIAIFGGGGEDAISVRTLDGPGYVAAAISGGDGSDQLFLNFDGAIWGGAGNDVITVRDSFRGEAYGEGGDDTIYIQGLTIDGEIIGGAGNDFIDCSRNRSPVTVRGSSGDDTILGSEFNDRLHGDEGTDVIYGMAGNDMLIGTEYAYGGDGYDTLYGYAVQHDSIERILA